MRRIDTSRPGAADHEGPPLADCVDKSSPGFSGTTWPLEPILEQEDSSLRWPVASTSMPPAETTTAPCASGMPLDAATRAQGPSPMPPAATPRAPGRSAMPPATTTRHRPPARGNRKPRRGLRALLHRRRPPRRLQQAPARFAGHDINGRRQCDAADRDDECDATFRDAAGTSAPFRLGVQCQAQLRDVEAELG